jgi:hypothetical protein
MAEIFYNVAVVLQGMVAGSDINMEKLRILPGIISQLVCRALVVCSPSLVTRLLALSIVTSMCESVDRQCEAATACQASTCPATCCVLVSIQYCVLSLLCFNDALVFDMLHCFMQCSCFICLFCFVLYACL